ncbi:ferredoxin (2Fe-2S) [Stanieria cyanosphaera PCC 7437]|uniref:Ferredoxin (2Fe-2S) n=1 Tax=Stanieria cyanosphaera (strain ATCC 29371 / PCC 7437) TaxID=111780 RepID=K9XWZ0_STAC7|nr:2Fe-2S iron-sulfur cluster-binding protein [Stanieria cyanosphaera]AFZ37115.1 ferredoxin (2Fe-2S) [Stanieria cyanosphaera PCC 7437]
MNTITKTYNVTLINEGKGINQTIQVNSEEYILDIAEVEGLTLPYSCRNGCCFDCLGKVLQGQVEQTAKALEFLSPDELKAGYILTCAACPRSDCTIVTDQAEELFS